MFCNKCGKEISDQARFCNYCGAAVNNTQPRQPAQPQAAQQAQSTPAKKKGKVGKTMLTILVALVVYFGVRAITENVLTSQRSTSTQASTSTANEYVEGDKDLTATCFYGALYENDDLTYGLARVHLPGYHLLPGEGDVQDYLCSANQSTLFYTTKKLEIGISYDASDSDSILNSYSGSSMSNVSMIDFRKYEVDGYPVIRYIISCTVDGLDEYIGELIICPSKQPSETLRMCMETLSSNGYGAIDQVFDTLDISSAYALSADDTQTMGLNRITVK